jgi:osmotically-inducible protein OsmY
MVTIGGWSMQGILREPCLKTELKVQFGYHDFPRRLDEDIARTAKIALQLNASVASECVKVRVLNGVVTLSGEVAWEYQKFAAGEAVRYLTGVVSVDNQITIKPRINSRW